MIFLSPAWFDNTFLGVEVSQYLGVLAVITAATIVSFLITTSVRYIISKRAPDHRRAFWLSEFRRVNRGILFLAISVVALIAVPTLQFADDAENIIRVIARLIAAVSVVVIAFRLADIFTDYLVDRASGTETKLDDQLVPLVRTILKAFIIAIGLLFILQNLDVDITSLIAGLGLGGLAFALAAQDSVRNFIGGITILADKPFQIGDWVKAVGVEGVVESVGFRSTQIRTFYNSLITIPNSKIADSAIDNFGARQYRRYSTTLGLTYDTRAEQIQAFVEGVRAILQANSAIRQDYYEVHFKGFGDFALEIMVYCFFEVPSWSEELKAKHQVLIEIKRLASELGVEFAFPTQTLHLSKEEATAATNKDLDALKASVEAFGPEGHLSQPHGTKLTHGFFPNN